MSKDKGSKNRKTGKMHFTDKMSQEKRNKIAAHAEKYAAQLCSDEGIELVHIEFVAEDSYNILRVYIDKPDGVSMDDCTNINRQLGDLLDVNINIKTEYRLEVSSPGIYRPLFKKEDYTRYAEKNVEITTTQPVEGKKKLKGVLKGISENDSVTLSVNENIVEIDYSSIKIARLAEDNGDDRC